MIEFLNSTLPLYLAGCIIGLFVGLAFLIYQRFKKRRLERDISMLIYTTDKKVIKKPEQKFSATILERLNKEETLATINKLYKDIQNKTKGE